MECARGLTLTEIVVIIAILILGVSLIFPLMARSRESARREQCASQLMCLGKVMVMYADIPANGGMFPSTESGG